MQNQTNGIFKTLTMIWFVILISYFSLTGIIFFISQNSETSTDKQLNAIFLYISIFSIMALIPSAYYVYGFHAKSAKKIQSDTEKFNLYKKAFVLKTALIEFAGMLPLIAFYLTKQTQCLFMAMIPIIIFLINKPSETRFKEDFYENGNLDNNENQI